MINTDTLVARFVSRRELLLFNRFPTSTVILRRKLPNRFEQTKRHSEDYLLWLEICLSGHVCARLPAELAYVHKGLFGEGGLSDNLWAMELGELDNYRKLFSKRYINGGQYALLYLWSWSKFFKRAITSLKYQSLGKIE